MKTSTRQQLVDAAVRRFYRDGFRNVGIDQILSDVGTPVGCIRLKEDGTIDEYKLMESSNNPELDDYELRVAMKKAMIDVRNLDRHGKLPSSTAQGLFAKGLKRQQFGDLMSAWELYEQAIEAVPPEAPRELAAYRRLAEKGIAEIKASPDANRSLSEMADAKLAEADELIAAKKYLPAKVLLAEFIGLYEGNGKLREQVSAARGKLQEIDARRK